MLIRPDDDIGFRSQPVDPAALLKRLARALTPLITTFVVGLRNIGMAAPRCSMGRSTACSSRTKSV